MQIDFTNKTVLITGASRGIGRATAIKFAENGAQVIIHYKDNGTAALKTLSMLPGDRHFLLKADLTNVESVDYAVKKAYKKVNRIDILVNNAGIYKRIDFFTCTFSEWQKHFNETFQVNILGMANLTYLVARNMILNGGGKIINVSSRGAFRGEPLAPAYGASKAAVNQFSQSLARLLGSNNIFVYAVAPGFVDTEMSASVMKGEFAKEVMMQSPLNRIARPEEVANTIALLASEDTDFLTGGIIDINGASYLRS